MADTLDFFKKVSDYFGKQTVCPRHRIEHTGKNVYSIVVDLELYRQTGEVQYFERARARVQRTLKNLTQDPDSGAWIFYPGRLNRWNMANSVIDAGACVDALSGFLMVCGEKLSQSEREEISAAVFKVADTYLKNAAVSKEITNQRLWGATGLSRAWRIFKKDDWKAAALESVNKSLREMWPDGTFPYHSLWKEYKIYKGIYDTTTFYHSRCSAFIYYILENIGQGLDDYRDQLIKAADLLTAMYQPNGIKNINLECKRWYWLSSYEVASNAFDVYALTKAYKMTGLELYAYYAQKSLEKILLHQLPDGGITSHLGEPQNNFQCRIFWNSNLAWLARAAQEFPPLTNAPVKEFRHFQDSDILKFKNDNYSCILRGKKKPMSLMLGPAMGGGSLLYFGGAKDNWENAVANEEGGFILYARENYWRNIKEYISSNKKEIRSRIYHLLVELHAFNLGSFFALLRMILRDILESGRGVYASRWATSAAVQKDGDRVIFRITPAKKNGQELKAVEVKREYIFQPDRLLINERLNRTVIHRYAKPRNAKDFSSDGEVSYSYYLD